MLARTGAFLGFVAVSAVAGGLVAALALPAVAMLHVGTGVASQAVASIPDELRIDQLAQRNNIYARDADGNPVPLATFYDQNRVEVGFDDISQYAKDAALAAEDPRFYEHGGIDLKGTVAAVAGTVFGGELRGGSSITQQYVKNVLVQQCEALPDVDAIDSCYEEATETSVSRKLKEMRLAIGVNKQFSKDDVLRGYLNIAGFGGTVYGIEAAANYYYNTTAAALTLPQSASLLAIVNNPVKFQLDKPDSDTNGAGNGYAANKDRRDYILSAMLEHGKITADEHAAAVATPVEPVITVPTTGCQEAGKNAYFCDYVVSIMKSDPAFGATAEERAATFRRGGLDVYTTLDLDVQGAAVDAIAAHVPSTFDGWDVGGVITSVEVGTGRVLAMAQNKDYSQDPDVLATGDNYTSVNYNTDFAHGGSSGFQPGSTYKVFTLAEWLTSGHQLDEYVDSKRKSNWGTFTDSCLGPQNYDEQGWNPKNDSGESGWRYSAQRLTIESINTGFIGMAKKLDLCNIRKTAEAFGVHRADGEPLGQNAASVLGTNEIAPLTMAAAFAGIANGGVTCAPRAIDSIVNSAGVEVAVPAPACSTSVAPRVASELTYTLERVMREGTATASFYDTYPRVPMIGKTGTTDDNKDTWMIGASSKVATVAGVVSVNGEANQRSVYFDTGSAATARHRMWPEVMSVVNDKFGGDSFPENE